MRALVYLTALLLCVVSLPNAQAEEYGRVRAMQQRAAEVAQKKNNYIDRVLTTYGIPHERNGEGAVVRLTMDGRRVAINRIEIIPLLKEGADKKQQVAGHELLFYTPQGMFSLVSELVIR